MNHGACSDTLYELASIVLQLFKNCQMSLRIAAAASLLSLTFLAISNSPAQALQKVLSGQVRNDKNKTLSGVKVDLWTTDNSVSMTTRTDDEGKFSFRHPKCGTCTLEVFAPKKSNLASALVEVPGDEARTVMVSLKKGYPVFGRIVSNGKGLKGIVVKAYSARHERNEKERIYGGGAVVSQRGGDFSMTLTPGDKKLVLLNNKYDHITKMMSLATKVITETDLGDLEMPTR